MKILAWITEACLRNRDHRNIFNNIFSLSVLQFINYLFPLVTLPYLVRTLGPSRYGMVALAGSFIEYFITLTDYGFNYSAVRLIAQASDKKGKLRIFTSVMVIKIMLLSISFIALLFCVNNFDFFRIESLLYLFTFGNVIASVLFPVWFFQGIEKMRYITVLSFVAKAVFTISVFIYINSPADYLYVALINSTANMGVGFLSMIIIVHYFDGEWEAPSFQDIEIHMREGWYTFVANSVTSFYTVGNAFLLGMLTNTVNVGYYSAGEKIIRIIRGIVGPITDSLYPFVSRKYHESVEIGNIVIRKMLLLFTIGTSILAVATVIFANSIVRIVLGPQYLAVIPVIRLLSPIIILVPLSNIAGVQAMLNMKLHKEFMWILIIASGLHIGLMVSLVPILPMLGAPLSVIMTEAIVTISMLTMVIPKTNISRIG